MDKVNKTSLGMREYVSICFLASVGIVLIGAQNHLLGWTLFTLGLVVTLFTYPNFRKYILLIYGSFACLGLVPITTATTNENFLKMGLALSAAVALPYLTSRFLYHEKHVDFRFRMGRQWVNREVFYIFFTAVIAYLLLPFYLRTSGAYLNWGVDLNTESIVRLFIGTNALGIWDELFFISTVLGVIRLFFSFKTANILQAILFTSFLYDLGFTGWGPFIVYPFALLQGYIFKRTNSLIYVITIHLTLDFILFLALINAHHPTVLDIFIT